MNGAAPLSPADLAQLRKFDTPTICNVLELANVRPRTAGYCDARIKACFPKLPPMVGFASTAVFRASSPPRAGEAYGGLVEQVQLLADSFGPAVVVFQDMDDPPVAATFGEVMCTTYKSFGAVGLVTSGAGRDLEQVAALDLPCFTSGTICSHGYTQIVQLNGPVRVGGVTIYPGDLLHGDCNGLTTLPIAIAAIIAEHCSAYMAAEALVLDYLRAGSVTPAGYKQARQAYQAELVALAQRVRTAVNRVSESSS